MIWIREPFLSKGPELKDLIVIHGHTVREQPDPGPQRSALIPAPFTRESSQSFVSKEAKVDFFNTSFANVQLVAKALGASSCWRLKIRSNDVFCLYLQQPIPVAGGASE